MDSVECVVIGAGVVGLAVARALAMAGREVVILEAEDAIGTHTSSRNSEVIHAGIYYPKGSLKARACVAGRHLLYEYCATHGVPHRRCGKLIVATNEASLHLLVHLHPLLLHHQHKSLKRSHLVHFSCQTLIDSCYFTIIHYLSPFPRLKALLFLSSICLCLSRCLSFFFFLLSFLSILYCRESG